MVASPRDRGLCDPPDQHPGVARTPTGEDGPAGRRIIDAGDSRLAPRRAEALQQRLAFWAAQLLEMFARLAQLDLEGANTKADQPDHGFEAEYKNGPASEEPRRRCA